MTVYLAWTSADPTPDDLRDGPWEEVRVVAPGLLLLESTERLSPVYHQVKWSLPEGAALIVQALHERPKLKGLAPGTTTWLRDRLPVTLDGGEAEDASDDED